MSSSIYIYPATPSGQAALHLAEHSALANITLRTATFWAGADAIKVKLDTPRPSRGEQLLWVAMESLACEQGGIDVVECARHLDERNLSVLMAAVAMVFGIEAAA